MEQTATDRSGMRFGFIRSMFTIPDTDATTIIFDEAEWAHDNETAELWSKQDAGCWSTNPPKYTEGCNIPNGFTPNGFYIRNKSYTTEAYTPVLAVQIRLMGYNEAEQSMELMQDSSTAFLELKKKVIA